MVDEVEFVAYVLAFTVDIDPFVDIACHKDFVCLEHLDMLAELEMVGIDQRTGDREVLDGNLVNNTDVDKPVVEFGLRSHGRIVAKLVTVGESGQGVNINIKTNDGMTNLHIASQKGFLELTQWFVGQGADINAITNEGKTVIILANKSNNSKLIQWLKEHGAK